MDEQRTRETRARAELALVRLAHELRDEDVFLVVLGGLVPDVLTVGDGLIPEHLGTTDVDVLLIRSGRSARSVAPCHGASRSRRYDDGVHTL